MQDFSATPVEPVAKSASGSSKKLLIIITAIIAGLVAVGALVYFVILPRFFPKTEPVVEQPVVIPPIENPAPPPGIQHQSFFVQQPAATTDINLASFGQEQLTAGLKAQEETLLPKGSIREVVFKLDGSMIGSNQFLPLMASSTLLEAFVTPDFTSFVYYTDKNAWPGYIFKLKDGAVLKTAQTAAAKIEKLKIASFYPNDPGAAAKAGFRNGTASGVKTRYLSFAKANTSFTYGWKDNYLIVSTSFDGFKKALSLLQPPTAPTSTSPQ